MPLFRGRHIGTVMIKIYRFCIYDHELFNNRWVNNRCFVDNTALNFKLSVPVPEEVSSGNACSSIASRTDAWNMHLTQVSLACHLCVCMCVYLPILSYTLCFKENRNYNLPLLKTKDACHFSAQLPHV